jgi:hypothetical protein
VIIPDANLLLYASDSSSPFHRAASSGMRKSRDLEYVRDLGLI